MRSWITRFGRVIDNGQHQIAVGWAAIYIEQVTVAFIGPAIVSIAFSSPQCGTVVERDDVHMTKKLGSPIGAIAAENISFLIAGKRFREFEVKNKLAMSSLLAPKAAVS